jgi:hypothetical protein
MHPNPGSRRDHRSFVVDINETKLVTLEQRPPGAALPKQLTLSARCWPMQALPPGSTAQGTLAALLRRLSLAGELSRLGDLCRRHLVRDPLAVLCRLFAIRCLRSRQT